MAEKESVNNTDENDVDLEQFLEESGKRTPTGIPAKVLIIVPFIWSMFQLWIASPLPFLFNIGVFNSSEARSTHLAFAIFLSFTAFPALKRSPKVYIPIQDWIIAFVGSFAAGYIYIFY